MVYILAALDKRGALTSDVLITVVMNNGSGEMETNPFLDTYYYSINIFYIYFYLGISKILINIQ